MYSCARLTRSACASSVKEGAACENFPGARAKGTPPRSARITSRRNACRSASVPSCMQCDAARQVIEHQQRTRCDIVCVRRRRCIETAAGDALEIAHGIVRGIADQAAQQGYAGNMRNRLRRARQCAAQHVEEFVPAPRAGRMHAADVHALRLDAHLETIAEADEGVAREPLAALDAFQQESRTKGRELQIRGDRRVQVGCNVKRRLHSWPIQGNKKPIATCRGDGFWVKRKIES